MKPLHHALREARVRAGLTQTQAAELSGINRNQLCMYENGSGKTAGINLHTALTLASTYGETVSELIGEVPPADRRMNVKERRVVDVVLEAMRAE